MFDQTSGFFGKKEEKKAPTNDSAGSLFGGPLKNSDPMISGKIKDFNASGSSSDAKPPSSQIG